MKKSILLWAIIFNFSYSVGQTSSAFQSTNTLPYLLDSIKRNSSDLFWNIRGESQKMGSEKDFGVFCRITGTKNRRNCIEYFPIKAEPGTTQFRMSTTEVELGGIVGNGWTYTWNQTGKRFMYVIAQSEEREGSVTVKLYKNGKVIAKDTKSGEFATASITGNY